MKKPAVKMIGAVIAAASAFALYQRHTGARNGIRVQGTEFVRTAQVLPAGDFRFEGIPAGTYQVQIKAEGYLSKTITVDARQSIANLQATLRAGDANNDNTIDVFDLDIVVGAFNSVPTFANWNPAADFNRDDSVDVYDLDLLIQNFGETGD